MVVIDGHCYKSLMEFILKFQIEIELGGRIFTRFKPTCSIRPKYIIYIESLKDNGKLNNYSLPSVRFESQNFVISHFTLYFSKKLLVV